MWRCCITLSSMVILAACTPAASPNGQEQTLQFLDQMMEGTFSNEPQIAQEDATGVEGPLRHDLSYQTFIAVDMPNLEGVTFLLEASSDGTEDTIIGRGVYHAYAASESDTVLLRLKRFKPELSDQGVWNQPDILRTLTNDDLTWTEGCAFYLRYNTDASRVEGTMKEQSCFFGEGDSKMNHHDEFVLSETELWSNGRFYDMDGNFLFGNAAGSPVILTKKD